MCNLTRSETGETGTRWSSQWPTSDISRVTRWQDEVAGVFMAVPFAMSGHRHSIFKMINERAGASDFGREHNQVQAVFSGGCRPSSSR